jgi:hypothetical protein
VGLEEEFEEVFAAGPELLEGGFDELVLEGADFVDQGLFSLGEFGWW